MFYSQSVARLVSIGLFGCSLLGAPVQAAPLSYTIDRVGLTDAGHTRNDGYQQSQMTRLNALGQAIGHSYAFSGATDLGRDAWLYTGNSTVQLGYSGTGYQTTTGTRLSEALRLNSVGTVVGVSRRYSGTTQFGQDAWLYSGGTTTQLGYNGGDYQATDGTRSSSAALLNDQGRVVGASFRYSGTTQLGQDAWMYSGGITTQLGYTGGAYQATNGKRSSVGYFLNGPGQVAGTSDRYLGNGIGGRDAWLRNGAATVQIGLTGAGYQRTDGFRRSDICNTCSLLDENGTPLNDQGQVIGTSRRYTGNIDFGADAWIYNGTSTVRIGLIGTGYQQTNGYRFSAASFLTQDGKTAGYSIRYSGTANLGQDTWLYNGTSTVQIGLAGSGYVQSNGTRNSAVWSINDAGNVVGISDRYSGSTAAGYGAWLYNGTATLELGYTGVGFQRSDGYRESRLGPINELGQVAGYSNRYSGSTDLGRNAWLYDSGVTTQLGFTGVGYEQSNGYRFSSPGSLNELGQVYGLSKRYSGTTDLGQHAWLYDSALEQIFDLTLSVRQSDGYAYSFAQYIDDSGLVLGQYSLFDQSTNADLGLHAFYFTVEDGVFDLGSLVEDLGPDGWLLLATAISDRGAGSVIGGSGITTGMTGTAAYMLKQASPVPIPAAAWLFGGALGLLGVARRRSAA